MSDFFVQGTQVDLRRFDSANDKLAPNQDGSPFLPQNSLIMALQMSHFYQESTVKR